MDYHPGRTSPSIGSQVRTAAAPDTCSGLDALLLQLLLGGASGRNALAPAGRVERVPLRLAAPLTACRRRGVAILVVAFRVLSTRLYGSDGDKARPAGTRRADR